MALENRLGITDSAELARTEEKISKQKALKLFETGILDTLKRFVLFINIYLKIFTTLREKSEK